MQEQQNLTAFVKSDLEKASLDPNIKWIIHSFTE
jgi:hypothetical protein